MDEVKTERVTEVVAEKPENVQAQTQEIDADGDKPLPTEEENVTLRRVADNLPWVAFSLCLVEFAERASYYGAKTVYSNFIEYPLPKGGNGAGAPPRGTQETAGALGMGLQASSGLTLLFTFLAYVIPIFGDGGQTSMLDVGVIPSVLQRGPSNAAPPFIIGLLILAFGAGIFKPNVAPLVLDQSPHKKPFVRTLKSGERVIVDPEATANRIMLLFYGFVNIGAFYMLATTYAEKYVGYWLSFLLSAIIYFLLPILLLAVYKKTHKEPPNGGKEITEAFQIIAKALRGNKLMFWRKDFWDAAKPSKLGPQGATVTWTDKTIDKVAKALGACDIFLYYPIWYLNDGGIGSVSTNQGGSMVTNGAPNDSLFSLMLFIPALRRFKITPGPITRISFGFFLATLSSIAGTLVQWKVYELSPCGYQASTCDQVAPISIWWQLPNTILSAISECFCAVTGYEVAYARAPKSMKGLVMAVFLFMNALSSALGEILIPVTKDPYLLWIWGAPAVALAAEGIIFWFRFKHLNKETFYAVEELDEKDAEDQERQAALKV
ncbi:hypothetical protein N7470_009642 [Penicillium chermesinum]|nr:hypothetical protein N7470_009642 [Penicillium chermesinum]